MSPHDKRATRVTVVVFFTVFLDLVGFGIIIPLLPLYVSSMGGTALTVGFLFTSFSFTQLIATPILGRLSDRVGRRRVMLTSLAGNAASMVLFAAATEMRFLPLLFVSRILAGATAGNISACQAAIADVTEGAERAKGMGRIGAGISLGMMLGPALGSLASILGPAAAPLAAAALALVDLVAAFFLMPETRVQPTTERAPTENADGAAPYRDEAPPPGSKPRRPSILDALAEPAIAQILVLYFLTFLYMTTLQVALPLLAGARVGWSGVQVGFMFALFGLIGLIVQGGLIGSLTRRFGAQNLVIVGALFSIAGLLGIAVAHTGVALVGGLAAFGIGLSLTTPLLSALASDRAGSERRGMVLGFAQAAGGLARTIGPVTMGALYGQIGPGAPFVAGACSAFVALVLATVMRARSNKAVPVGVADASEGGT